MTNHRDLAVLDAADLVADEINHLIDSSPRRLIHVHQLRKAAQSIGATSRKALAADRGQNAIPSSAFPAVRRKRPFATCEPTTQRIASPDPTFGVYAIAS